MILSDGEPLNRRGAPATLSSSSRRAWMTPPLERDGSDGLLSRRTVVH